MSDAPQPQLLHLVIGGELTDLMRVRRYLDIERGAW